MKLQLEDFEFLKEMKHMVALKAAIETNGNIEKLIKKALLVFKPTLPYGEISSCPECGYEKMITVKDDYKTPNGTVIHNVPTDSCPNCGEKGWSLFVIAELERYTEDHPDSNELDFIELVNKDMEY